MSFEQADKAGQLEEALAGVGRSVEFTTGMTAEVISVRLCTVGESCHAVVVALPEYGLTMPI